MIQTLRKILQKKKKVFAKKMHELALKDAGEVIPRYVKNWPKYKVYGGLKW